MCDTKFANNNRDGPDGLDRRQKMNQGFIRIHPDLQALS